MAKTGELFEKLVAVISRLRDPNGGCPWDLKQNHQTITPYLLEEAYEVIECIEHGNGADLPKELGDVLLQVVLHAQIGRDHGTFNIDDVVTGITEKMIRRHPHVFGDVSLNGTVNDTAEVLRNWEQIKLQERAGESGGDQQKTPSILEGVPRALPALIRAQRLGEKAARTNFDWRSIDGVWEKVLEELEELKDEIRAFGSDTKTNQPLEHDASCEASKKKIRHELGDLLFSLCQLSRWLGIHAEDTLREAADRFTTRFQTMESILGRPVKDLTDDELEAVWQQAKKALAEREGPDGP